MADGHDFSLKPAKVSSTMKRLCAVSDVPEDDVILAELEDGRKLAVYNYEGEFYCTDDLCSHGEASLSDGEIEDGSIVCPFHLGAFCIKTGEPTAAPCTDPIKAYKVRREGDDLFIDG